MIHTLDFVYDLRRDADTRKNLLHWLETPGREPIFVGAFRLEWLTKTSQVRISLWDESYPFCWKCPEYECHAQELAELIQKWDMDKIERGGRT